MKHTKLVFFLGVVILSGVVLSFVYSIKFRLTDEEYVQQIADEETDVLIDYHEYDEHKVRNILVDRGHDRLFILLHGAPSSSAQWVPLVNDTLMREKVDFLLIDRPGYGFSNFGKPILDIEKQAEIVHQITSKYAQDYDQLLMLGTSYGGTVATRFMMDYPEYLDAGVLVASSMAPGEERIYEISYAIEQLPWLFPDIVLMANLEKMSHFIQLKKMVPFWKRIKNPIHFIHATNDDLIYPENVNYALDHLNPNIDVDTTWVEGGEHSLYSTDRVLVFRELYAFVEKYKNTVPKSFARTGSNDHFLVEGN
ncbi:MAG: alpha/beta fold hydrolase [Bacteroidota bacterium]